MELDAQAGSLRQLLLEVRATNNFSYCYCLRPLEGARATPFGRRHLRPSFLSCLPQVLDDEDNIRRMTLPVLLLGG